MRAKVSLLLSQGHSHARRYPLIVVWQEAQIVKERMDGLIATEVLAHYSANVAIHSTSKRAGQSFNDLIKGLQDGR